MNVCIVDDKIEFIEQFSSLLTTWQLRNNIDVNLEKFTNYQCFIEQNMHNYNIIFLDIELDDFDGMEIAQELRNLGYKNEIVFLTAYSEYVFKGYSVHALNYIMKPITYQMLDNCLQYVTQKFSDENFIYQSHNDIIKIPYKDILYFSGLNQYVEIITKDNKYKVHLTLKSITKELPKTFVQCHRSIIINVYHINKIKGKDIYLDSNDIIPISNTYLHNVRKVFSNTLK